MTMETLVMTAGAVPFLIFAYAVGVRLPSPSATFSQTCNTISFENLLWADEGICSRMLQKHQGKLIRLHRHHAGLRARLFILSDASYALIDRQGNEIIALKKMCHGWAIIRIDAFMPEAKQFVTPFILELEKRIFN